SPMLVTDFMKLDVATKDKKYTDSIRDGNNKVSGSACMSQKDCDTIKAQKADICTPTTTQPSVSCYCTTDECTGSSAAQVTFILLVIMQLYSFLLIAATSLPLASALTCLHNSTVTNAIYSNGMLVRAYSSNYNLGLLECSTKLTRCVNFKAMDISFFNTLDVAQDKSIFVNLIKGNNGKVVGRSCMSEADVAKIKAEEKEECMGKQDNSCYCTTDECTGASGVQMTLASLMMI
ncbi:hypothetical protein PENTCL1PPCAC_5193, partial [Pristionchus entomophagus]